MEPPHEVVPRAEDAVLSAERAPAEASWSFRKFLVTGSGRSGTRYTALLLSELGLDVRHESLGSEGIVSWYAATDSDAVPYGPPSSRLVFRHVFHQVRHPLRVIPSLATLRPETWAFVARHVPCSPDDPPLVRCAKLWLHWNLLAERRAEWRYRIEDLPDIFDEFCRRFGVPCDRRALERLPRDVNTRPPRLATWFSRLESREYLYRLRVGARLRERLLVAGGARSTLSWETLDLVDSNLCRRIHLKAREYGYE